MLEIECMEPNEIYQIRWCVYRLINFYSEIIINIPFDYYEDYEDVINELDDSAPHVIYCSGEECSLSMDLADYLFNEFSRKEEKISKAQELKADVFGSKASSDAKVFINGLAKLYIYGLVWDEVENGYREIVRQKVKTKIENLSMEFISHARKNLDKKKLLEFLEHIADYQQEHPNDTHPPFKERMENLNVKLDDMTNKSLMNFLPSSASLIPNVDIIEENMTTIIKIIEERRS